MNAATKIIFLDFDGPLSNARTALAYGEVHSFDGVAIHGLNAICHASGAKIVCSSWRTDALSTSNAQENIALLVDTGLDRSNLHRDWSCCIDLDKKRGWEIRKWLRAHPEVTHFAIIDDDVVRMPNFVKVSQNDGMKLADFEKIARFLDFDLGAAFLSAQTTRLSRNPRQYELNFDNHPPAP